MSVLVSHRPYPGHRSTSASRGAMLLFTLSHRIRTRMPKLRCSYHQLRMFYLLLCFMNVHSKRPSASCWSRRLSPIPVPQPIRCRCGRHNCGVLRCCDSLQMPKPMSRFTKLLVSSPTAFPQQHALVWTSTVVGVTFLRSASIPLT